MNVFQRNRLIYGEDYDEPWEEDCNPAEFLQSDELDENCNSPSKTEGRSNGSTKSSTGYDKLENMDRWYMHPLRTDEPEVIIARYQEGVCLNPLEYLLTEESKDYLEFPNRKCAERFLEQLGFTEDDIIDTIFVSAMCLEEM